MTGTVSELALQFAALTEAKRELAAEAKKLNATLTMIEDSLISAFAEEQVSKVTVELRAGEGWTIGSNTLAWARLREGTQKEALAILKSEGMEDMLTINSTKLSGLYREDVDVRKHGGKVFSDEFVALLDVNERTKVSARKA